MLEVINMTKVCSKCKQELPVESFYKSRVTKDGRMYRCISCCKEDSQSEKAKERRRLYNQTDKAKEMKKRYSESEVAKEKRRQWDSEPDVGRVANGVPSRVDRLKCLGNSIVPQIAELIFEQAVFDLWRTV